MTKKISMFMAPVPSPSRSDLMAIGFNRDDVVAVDEDGNFDITANLDTADYVAYVLSNDSVKALMEKLKEYFEEYGGDRDLLN